MQIRLKLKGGSEADAQPVFRISNVALAGANELEELIALIRNISITPAGTVAMTGLELKAYPAEPVEKAHFLSVMQLAP